MPHGWGSAAQGERSAGACGGVEAAVGVEEARAGGEGVRCEAKHLHGEGPHRRVWMQIIQAEYGRT